jgi:hypothetical protein
MTEAALWTAGRSYVVGPVAAFERVVQDPLPSPEVAATFKRAAGG